MSENDGFSESRKPKAESRSIPLLVTSALPYANGPVHLGHLVEHIQTNIWVRFQRMLGRDVLYVCAADTHGTPIEVNARKLGLEPADMVERFRREHERDFAGFDVAFDTYYTTNSPENRAFAERIYERLRAGGHVFEQPVEQFYCENDRRFLPDRFVKGACPSCGAADQYGDVCERCNKTYTPVELKDPYCTLCRRPPVRRESRHLFVRLSTFAPFLREFSARLQPEVRNYVTRWLDEGLKDWCISRDGPYFGFPIPGAPDKFFYVWLDAPVGYIASAAHACRAKGLELNRYWPGTDGPAGGQAEIAHFIGKDIVYFHTLFWPAMLHAAGFALPQRVQVHGMLNLGGAKMSKSRGRMVSAREWLDALDPSYLRYYLAANLGPALDDIEFTTDELRNRVNSQLVNNVGNLVNRALAFCAKSLDARLGTPTAVQQDLGAFPARAKEAFAELNLREAVKQVESLSAFANEFMQAAAPWKTIRTDPARARSDVTLVANVAKVLATMLAPVVPRLSDEIFRQLGLAPQAWEEGTRFDLHDHTIGVPKPLLPPMDAAVVESLFAPKEDAKPAPVPVAAEIAWDDFAKLDLRVGRVISAERVPKADKLLRLQVDVGEGEPRTIAAGIATAYAPEEMAGRHVVVVANLAPRVIRGVESRGMLLAASGGSKGLSLAEVPADVAPGTRVK